MPDFPLTIENQKQLDDMIESRLQRARQQWDRENSIPELERERDEARNQASRAERDAFDRLVRRDARDVLASMNVTDPKASETVLRLADLSGVEEQDGEPVRKQITDAIKAVHADTPGVFPEGSEVRDAAPDQGSNQNGDQGETLTREKIEAMTPREINGMWDRVQAFLAGERN